MGDRFAEVTYLGSNKTKSSTACLYTEMGPETWDSYSVCDTLSTTPPPPI